MYNNNNNNIEKNMKKCIKELKIQINLKIIKI